MFHWMLSTDHDLFLGTMLKLESTAYLAATLSISSDSGHLNKLSFPLQVMNATLARPGLETVYCKNLLHKKM